MTVNRKPMDSCEVELRQQVKKVLDPKGALKSIRHAIETYEKELGGLRARQSWVQANRELIWEEISLTPGTRKNDPQPICVP